MAQASKRQEFERFSAAQRFEHFVLMVVFFGLVLTGLPQRYAGQEWAQWLINVLGGIESARIIHRFLATLLIVEAIYHGLIVAYVLFVRETGAIMWPGRGDLRNVREWVAYNLGRRDEPPRMPRYNFGEKAMYLGAVIGILILVITGFMLWNPIAVTRYLPGEVIPAARVVHGKQAILALLLVVTWHLYTTVLSGFNPSIFTGRLSREAMQRDHAQELDALEHGERPAEPPPAVLTRRKQRFWPVAGVVILLLIGGLYWFITFEETALITIPRDAEVIFVPQTMPEVGDERVGAAIWSTMRCAFCHSAEATGGAAHDAPALAGTGMTFGEFSRWMREGGGEMPAFGPSEIPDAYLFHLWTWLRQINATDA